MLKFWQYFKPGNERGKNAVADHVDETDDFAGGIVDRHDDSKAASQRRQVLGL